MEIDKRAKMVNDFCLTTVTIAAVVAISYMALTMAQSVSPNRDNETKQRIFIIETEDDCEIKSIIETTNIKNKQQIKYKKGDLHNDFFTVNNGLITIKTTGYYTLYSELTNIEPCSPLQMNTVQFYKNNKRITKGFGGTEEDYNYVCLKPLVFEKGCDITVGLHVHDIDKITANCKLTIVYVPAEQLCFSPLD
jgi:hypothetical protein